MKNPLILRTFLLVAGPGIAPRSSGYEPDELLLLYPAILGVPVYYKSR